MKNDFKVNFYDNKKIWDKIPINFNEPMHINEAIARGLHIRGLKSYYEIIQKNPKIKTALKNYNDSWNNLEKKVQQQTGNKNFKLPHSKFKLTDFL